MWYGASLEMIVYQQKPTNGIVKKKQGIKSGLEMVVN